MRPLIIAHRGASHLAPENTLTAFRLAKTLGADGFECDVQITRDRHLVVAHDYLTDLKTGVHGNIPDMDFDDLRQLDFGKWKSPEFAGEKIPTLEEVLEVAQDFRMVHIELKPYLDRDEEIVDRIIDAVLDAGLEEKAVLTSFEYGALRRVKERMPQMATCAMTLSPESQLSQPATFWEKLGLKKTDPLVEKLSSPQALSEAAALLEDPSSLDEENSVLIYYLKDRLDFLHSIFPGMNLAEILQQYYYQTDFVNYVAQFGFPVDYVGPEYHAFSGTKTLSPMPTPAASRSRPGRWAWKAGTTCASCSGWTRSLWSRISPRWPFPSLPGWASGTNHPKRVDSPLFWSIIVLYRTVLCETVRRSNIHSKSQTRRMIL